jgi:hypothetical protein
MRLTDCCLLQLAPRFHSWEIAHEKRQTTPWTTADVRTLKTLARKKTRVGKIAKKLKRTEGATRKKAFSLGVSLDARV